MPRYTKRILSLDNNDYDKVLVYENFTQVGEKVHSFRIAEYLHEVRVHYDFDFPPDRLLKRSTKEKEISPDEFHQVDQRLREGDKMCKYDEEDQT